MRYFSSLTQQNRTNSLRSHCCSKLVFDVITATMSDKNLEQLAEDVREFDRLMADHDACQSTDETQDLVIIDDVMFAAGDAKPNVDVDDTEHGGIELVQLPVPHDKKKSKQLTVGCQPIAVERWLIMYSAMSVCLKLIFVSNRPMSQKLIRGSLQNL